MKEPIQNLFCNKGAIRLFYLFCTIATCLFFPRFLFAQNLVKNSGFEQGTTSWSSECSIEIYPETVYGGSNPNNEVTEIDVERCFNQKICVADNTTYTISLIASRRIDAPPTTGFHISVLGGDTGNAYVSQDVYRTNTSWQFTPETFTFTIPAGSADKTVNLSFSDNMHQGSYGIIVDNIEMHPGPEMSLAGVNGAGLAVLNDVYGYSVLNSPADVSYTWSFDAGSTPYATNIATPSVSWSTLGTKNITVNISNDVCTIATLSTTALVVAILPVGVTDFTGNITGDDNAILRWNANEGTISHFVVERSSDGISYRPITTIADLNKTGTHSYSYTEAHFTSTVFYRLKLVDVTGHASYSPVVILKKTPGDFTMYPSSPAALLHYSVTVKQPGSAQLQVLNADGQAVIRQKSSLYQGENVGILDVSQLPAGLYFIKLSIPDNNTFFIRKFSKL